MDVLDLIGGKSQLAERPEIQPLIWGIHQAAVIQIEDVDVDVQDHSAWTVKEQGPPFRTALLPNHRSGWGDMLPNIEPKGCAANPCPRFPKISQASFRQGTPIVLISPRFGETWAPSNSTKCRQSRCIDDDVLTSIAP